MVVTGEARFKNAKSGTSKKTGKEYFTSKFLDEHAEEFVTFFVSQELFEECQKLAKDTPVILTLELAVASRYAKLVAIEVME